MDPKTSGISPELADRLKAAKTEEDFEALEREEGYALSDKHLEDIAGGRIDVRVTKCFSTHHC